MAGAPGDRELPETPTWAVALVCAVIVLLSVAMEHGLHKLGHVRAPCLLIDHSFRLGLARVRAKNKQQLS